MRSASIQNISNPRVFLNGTNCKCRKHSKFRSLNKNLLINHKKNLEMALPFYSDDAKAIRQKIYKMKEHLDEAFSESVNLELDRCAKWINEHNFSKIALQFPNSLLDHSVAIANELELETQKDTYILADTSYGSCCVDEVAAEHVSADAIIHFGHACLSVIERLPVLYIFGKCSLDVLHVVSAFKNSFPDRTTPIILYYEVNYYHAINKIAENLKEYENLVVSELLYPNEECKANLNENQTKIIKNQRYFILPKTKDLDDYTIFYIGCRKETFTNVMLCLNKCKFYMYNTADRTITDDVLNLNRFLMQRNYYIERTRDARIIGILFGTLGVSNFISTVVRLRKAIVAANKKFYGIAIGKVNVAKLANFAEIEVFVNVACLESTIVDCSGFYQPIITPYELEIALNMREFTDMFITDFAVLLPDPDSFVHLSRMKRETDVSLISGKLRSLGLYDTSDEDESTALVERDEMTISEIHIGAAGEFLSERSWKGLEQKLGETPPADIQQGKKGIASEYEGERTVH